MTAPCVRCGRPTDATICRPETRTLADQLLTAAGHAEDAEAVITRQVRYSGGGPRTGEERPMPTNLAASARLKAVGNTVTTWARHICETRRAELPARRPLYGPLCADFPCKHVSCERIQWRVPPSSLTDACGWLATQIEWLRKRPEAGEAFKELHDACAQLTRLVDRPADRELVGMCDCGKVLYARDGLAVVQCPQPTCKLTWNVDESRDILRLGLREKLFTASECARLAAFWNERTQPQIRALITTWTRPDRARLTARGWIPNDDYTGAEDDDQPQGWATYLLGDVLDLLAQTPRRHREGAAA
jgi:hypothetical protein